MNDLKRLTADDMRVLTKDMAEVVKINVRSQFMHVTDAEGNLRLGKIWTGMGQGTFLRGIERTRTYGAIIKRAAK